MIWGFIIFIAGCSGVILVRSLCQDGLTRHVDRFALVLTGALAVFVVPVFAVLVYVSIGNPNLNDLPLKPRFEGALEDLPPAAIMAKLEQAVVSHPDDIRGWRLLARLHSRDNMSDLAAQAWRQVLHLQADDIEAVLGLIIAHIDLNEGIIDASVQALIHHAVRLAPHHRLTLFYQGLAYRQDNNFDVARKFWQQSRDRAGEDKNWQDFMDKQLAAL